jgi:hypothetical protein
VVRKIARWFFSNLLWAPIQWGIGLVVATAIGIWSGLECPWNYTLAGGLGLITVGLLGFAVESYREGLPPPWGKPRTRGATEASQAMALGGRTDPTPESTGIPVVFFPMEGRPNRTVDLAPGRKPRAVRFIEPVTREVRAAELPKTIRWQLRKLLVVKRFSPGAMLVDEHLSGVTVRAELYYEDEP